MNRAKYNPETKIWSGSKFNTIYDSSHSLGYLILNVLKQTPDRITQVSADSNVEISCHEMRLRTTKIASHLTSSGFKQGDIVGIMASNSENLAPLMFACFTLGLPVNTLAPIMTENDIVHMYSKTKPKVVFCDANIVETVQKACDEMSLKSVIYTLGDKIGDYGFVDEFLLSDYDETEFSFPELKDVSTSTAMIMCSSGTTGLAKGVCLSHEFFSRQIFPLWTLKNPKQDVLFNFSTLYWITGVYFLIVGALYGGKRIITTKPFSPSLMANILNRFQVTTCLAPPFALAALLETTNSPLKSFESVEYLLPAGSIISKSLCEAIRPLFPNGAICSSYGTTEGCFLAGQFEEQRYGSVGKPAPNIHMKIIDDLGNNLGPNKEGEVCLKNAVKFSGYFGDPEKTKEAVMDGWLLTGDVGYFDDDGFLFLVDRKKDLLKFNSYQVYPSELESIINEVDGVVTSCVVGVLDEKTGNDLIFGFVVKDSSNQQLTEAEILNHVNGKVIDAKKLRGGIHFVKSFPMTPSGKIKRVSMRTLAKEYLANSLKH